MQRVLCTVLPCQQDIGPRWQGTVIAQQNVTGWPQLQADVHAYSCFSSQECDCPVAASWARPCQICAFQGSPLSGCGTAVACCAQALSVVAL
jgi:hypothetical protein